MERRTFCIHASQAAALAALTSALPGCGGSPTSPSNVPPLVVVPGTVSGNSITVTIDSVGPLSVVGGAALVQSSRGSFLVTRTTQTTFSALTAVCTHEGCTVSLFQNQTFVCECHGSQYNSTGGVVKGPASRPLQQFTAVFAGTTLTIT